MSGDQIFCLLAILIVAAWSTISAFANSNKGGDE